MNFTQEAGGECMLILPGGQGESICRFYWGGRGRVHVNFKQQVGESAYEL